MYYRPRYRICGHEMYIEDAADILTLSTELQQAEPESGRRPA
jgi:hypothetical protein